MPRAEDTLPAPQPERIAVIVVAVAILLTRFTIMFLGLQLAPLIGISGWYSGLFVNVLVSIYAVVLMNRYGLWNQTGMTKLWRSRLALMWLLPLVAEAIFWAVNGLDEQHPGFGLWALTLMLVGVNEELISRGVILNRLLTVNRAVFAVLIGATLFGLPLIIVHATTDFTVIHAVELPSDLVIVVVHLLVIAFGIALLRGRKGEHPRRAVA